MICLLETPAEFRPRITSRKSGIEVTVPGTPDGLTLIATTSRASKNFAQAFRGADSPVSDAMPASTIARTAGGDTRRSTMAAEWNASTTRPG